MKNSSFFPGSVLARGMTNILTGFDSITAAARQGACCAKD